MPLPSPLSNRAKLAVAAVAVAAVAALSRLVPPRRLLDVLASIDGPTLLAVLFACYLLRPAFAAPLSLFSVFVGYEFGPILGLAIALAGTVITCLPPFFAARWFRTDGGLFGRLARVGDAAFDETGGVRGMIAARLSPVPADAVSYGAGLSNLSLRTFVLGTLIGEVPWATGFVLVGHSLSSVSAADLDPSPELVAALTVLAALLVAGPAYRLLRRFRSDRSPDARGDDVPGPD